MSQIDDYINERKKKIGVTSVKTSPADDYVINRKMDLGMIPDTRQKNQPPTQAEMQKYGMSANPENSQIMQQAHQFVDTHSKPMTNEERFKDDPSRHIPIIGDVLRTLDKFASNKAAIKVGEIGRELYTPGAGASVVSGLTNAAENGIAKFAPKLANTFGGRVAKTALRESAVGFPLAVGQSLATGHDGTEALKQGAYGAVIGGALGGAGSAIVQKLQGSKFGDALSSFFSRSKVNNTEKPQETLSLMPASPESVKAWDARKGSADNINPVIYGKEGRPGEFAPSSGPLTLPEGKIITPKRLRIMGKDSALDSVMPKITAQAVERMTPPLENPNELAKWVQGHLNDAGYDISLNEVRGLDYEGLRQLAEEMRPRINAADVVRKSAHDMGYGNLYDGVPIQFKNQATDDVTRSYQNPSRATANIQVPNFNTQHIADAAMPVTKTKAAPEFKNPNDYFHGSKAAQTTGANGIRTDGLTIMQKYFPDGKIDTKVLSQLPLEERLQFQKEQAPGYIPENKDMKFGYNPSVKPSDIPTVDQKPSSDSNMGNNEVNQLNALDQNVSSDAVTADPHISSKVSSYLEEEIAAAKERISAKRYVSSPNPTIQNADHALVGATYIENGTKKLVDFTEQLVRQFGEEVRPRAKEIFNQSKQIFKDTETRISKDLQGLAGIEPAFLKDTGGFSNNTSDVYRVFKNLFKDKFGQVKKAILDPMDAAKMDNVKMQQKWLDKMYSEVVEKLGIEKGSKLSGFVQRYGEKDIDLHQLQKLAPKDWEKVVEADKFFRNAYDTIIEQVNATRKQIYPNNPDKIVPKRPDYYRHFQEFSSLTGLKNSFDTPAGIDPHLVGTSENTLPRSKFAGFMQKRGLGKYKNDAVGGFLEYLPGASFATHIDPQITVFKNLKNNLASGTEKSKNLDNILLFLDRFSQDLAGKTNSLDRSIQENIPGGRKGMRVLSWVDNRVKSNVILANAGSVIAQLFNPILGTAFAKENVIKGLGETLITAVKGNPSHEESQFLKERFLGRSYRKFDTKWLDPQNPLKTKNAAIWAMETADRLGTEFTWNSIHEKALKEGISNPVKYADDETRRLIGGRGIGEVPLLQKSKLFKLIAPFSLEIANLWRVQKDFIKAKDFGGLAILLLGSFMFNKVAEKVRGSGVTFDPIQAIIEASANNLSPAERFGRLSGEVVSNFPLGSSIASLYPEDGKKFMGMDLVGGLPTRKELFGDNDPTRFGTGLVAQQALTDPLFTLIPGFGGKQIKKTIDGLKTVINEGSYTGDKLKAPIDMNPLKAAQAITFGPNSTSEMQAYYDKQRRPLSEKQTQQYEALNAADKQTYYDNLMKQRKVDALQAEYKKATENQDTSVAEKQKKVDELIKIYNELVKAN